MKTFKNVAVYFRVYWAIVLFQARQGFGQSNANAVLHKTTGQSDGQKDSDFQSGMRKARLKRLVKPLSGLIIIPAMIGMVNLKTKREEIIIYV